VRVLVCGGREYGKSQDELLQLEAVLSRIPHIEVVIHGAARGADALAGDWARRNGVKEEIYPADWNSFGRAAGPMRNLEMLKAGKPDLVVAFPGGTGTAHMVKASQQAKVKVLIIP
jgi:hypothetical protein